MIILKIRFEDSDSTKRKPLNIERMTIEEEKKAEKESGKQLNRTQRRQLARKSRREEGRNKAKKVVDKK